MKKCGRKGFGKGRKANAIRIFYGEYVSSSTQATCPTSMPTPRNGSFREVGENI